MGNRPAHGSIEMPSSSSQRAPNDTKKSLTLRERGLENIHTIKSKIIFSFLSPFNYRHRGRLVELFFKNYLYQEICLRS